jgi:hypothetical protein
MADEVFIPINRRKMIIMTVVYSVLGIAAFLVTYYLGENQDLVSPTVFKVASVIVLLFFMVLAGTFAKNVKSTSAGLTISRKGIDDQANSISSGLIYWKDIKGISKIKTPSSKYILVMVKKPQKYIENAKNNAIKRLLNHNLANHKTPIVINVTALQTNLDELEGIIAEYSRRFGTK